MKKFVVIAGNNPGVIKRALLKRGNWEDVTEEKVDGEFDNVHFVWKPTNLAIRSYAKMDSNPPTDVLPLINHFENNRGICTKTGLIRSLRSYYYNTEQALTSRYTLFESTPTTFLITAGDENQEYVNFIARFRDINKKQWSKEHVPDKHCQENVWLIKPANMNQGRGIEIFNNLKDIQNFIQAQAINSYWVAQKYIEKPLLYYGRKFDIRVWVIVTAKNEIFFYKKPYMRTSSDVYVTNTFHNYVHLTNNCLQKHGDNFGKFESGNTLPLSTLETYLNEAFPQHNLSLDKHIVPRMKDLIIDTILSVKKAMNPKKRKNCFELFGYDFLIDEDFRTWLLEVNTNPYLGVPNDYIKDLLPDMVDDMFKIVLDPIHPPTNPDLQLKEGNDFELIYCEYNSVYNEGLLNVRSQYYENIYPIPSTAPNLRHIRAILNHDKENKEIRDSREVNNITTANFGLKSIQDDTTEDIRRFKNTGALSAKIRKTPSTKMTPVMTTEQQPETAPPLSPRTTREKRTSLISGGPPKEKPAAANHNHVAETIKKIEDLLDTYLVLDQDDLMPLISRLLSVLINWELHSDKEVSTTSKSILALSESRMSGILTETANITQMITLLDSQNVPLKVQVTLIKAFLNICRKISEKKKIVCDKMIHALIKITLASCDSTEIQKYDLQIIKLAAQCLGALSGKHDRRMYIPGETRDHDKVRDFLIHQGGILALLVISKKSLDEEIKEMPGRECFCYLGISDWELQKLVLEKTRDDKDKVNTTKEGPEEISDGPSSTTNARTKFNVGFLFPGGVSSSMPKLDCKKSIDTHYIIPATTPNIPKTLLERPDYTVDAMIGDIDETIMLLKEEKKKREQEEEERREQALVELMKEQQLKELAMSERRKKAEDLFLKRLEERKKVQDDITKKMEEEVKLRHMHEEERRRAKMLELIKKKEEFDKKAKMFEMKKKKAEEETKKILDEEFEKKKAQRKALEESFWTRIRAKEKEKEKQQDKVQQPAELSKRKEEHSLNADRTCSVEPTESGRYQEDSVEKPIKSSKTQANLLRQVSQPMSRDKSNTFSSFFPEDQQFKSNAMLGTRIKPKRKKEGRQKSVEDTRGRGKEKDESTGLPYIETVKGKKSKDSFEKNTKILKTSNLFTLDEAQPDEEANTFAEEKRLSNPVMKRIPDHPNSVRNDESEKLRRIINSTETMKSKNILYIKEYASGVEKPRDRAKENIKIERLTHKPIRQTSPLGSMNDLMLTSPYKGMTTRRRFRFQQAMVKY